MAAMNAGCRGCTYGVRACTLKTEYWKTDLKKRSCAARHSSKTTEAATAAAQAAVAGKKEKKALGHPGRPRVPLR